MRCQIIFRTRSKEALRSHRSTTAKEISSLVAVILLLFPGTSCSGDEPSSRVAAVDALTVNSCVDELETGGAVLETPFRSNGIQDPVQIASRLGTLSLLPRGPFPALMDCSLAVALQKASPIFVSVGLTVLHFSAAYDHRLRRGSTQLSSHAFGRAIDVHSLDGVAGRHNVATDFEARVGTWIGITPHEGALSECTGNPITEPGRRLRTLVCRLKLETDLRIIVTPDDNEDHRDHIHLEYAPPRMRQPHKGQSPSIVAQQPSVIKKATKRNVKKKKPKLTRH